MAVIQVPKTPEEREALKKEVQKFLIDHGGDSKSRTVTLKHFMKERNLPHLFVKKAMGRIGLEDKKVNPKQAQKIAKEKLRLQKRVARCLGSCEVLDSNAIQQVYVTLRQEGLKRRHIRNALFSLANKLGEKLDKEASKQLISLIRGHPDPAEQKTTAKAPSKAQVKKSTQKSMAKNEMNARKSVSFNGLTASADKKTGKKIPATPAVKKTPKTPMALLNKKSPKTPPAAVNIVTKAKTPDSTTDSPKAKVDSSPIKQSSTPTSSAENISPVVAVESKTPPKSPVNLEGSFISKNSSIKKHKRNSMVVDKSSVGPVAKSPKFDVESPKPQEKANGTPKASILKADCNANNNNAKSPGRRVSFGATESPMVKTPSNARKSMNLIDLNTPREPTLIADEECPSLVPINDEMSSAKKTKKSPKYSPRITRSVAKKKVPMF